VDALSILKVGSYGAGDIIKIRFQCLEVMVTEPIILLMMELRWFFLFWISAVVYAIINIKNQKLN